MTLPVEIRVVIPCYCEPEILLTVRSLWNCRRPACTVEVVVVVNSYAVSEESVKAYNRETYRELENFAAENREENLRLVPLLVEDLPGKQTGAGRPRRIGMDRAVEAFEQEENREGIVLSLDADCRVESNYLEEVFRCFKKEGLRSATIAFHHPVEDLPVEDIGRRAAEAYERYLLAYREALAGTGFPYAYFTLGSAFGVTARTYRLAGGMGRQEAGEDFYFLQKVFPLGRTRFIDGTRVLPSPRISSRVPFGTGPAIGRMVAAGEPRMRMFRQEAFDELKGLFGRVDGFFKVPAEVLEQELGGLPLHLQRFLAAEGFAERVAEIGRHTASVESFRKRFFGYFSAFRIWKYLKAVHPVPYAFGAVGGVGL